LLSAAFFYRGAVSGCAQAPRMRPNSICKRICFIYPPRPQIGR
jgi:hypothetical protein